MKVSPRRAITTMTVAILLVSLWQFAEAARIYLKAWLAESLIQSAWQRTQSGEFQVRPWPWADTWPVAELAVPRLKVNEIVLSGDSGRVLAFGPGMKEQSDALAVTGPTVISGHRDTSFDFLAEIQPGDAIELRSPKGKVSYTVVEQGVVDQRSFFIDKQAAGNALLLVTCYPFDDWVAGGDLRFIAVAQPMPQEPIKPIEISRAQIRTAEN